MSTEVAIALVRAAFARLAVVDRRAFAEHQRGWDIIAVPFYAAIAAIMICIAVGGGDTAALIIACWMSACLVSAIRHIHECTLIINACDALLAAPAIPAGLTASPETGAAKSQIWEYSRPQSQGSLTCE